MIGLSRRLQFAIDAFQSAREAVRAWPNEIKLKTASQETLSQLEHQRNEVPIALLSARVELAYLETRLDDAQGLLGTKRLAWGLKQSALDKEENLALQRAVHLVEAINSLIVGLAAQYDTSARHIHEFAGPPDAPR